MDISTRMTPSAKIALILILAVYGFITLGDPSHFRLLDNVDLAIHEAGHVLFSPLGEFIGFLGGTLMQLIVPASFFGYFLRHGDRYAAAVLLWWIGQNFWNISVYVKDARTAELPLVGGGEHDWAYILGKLGLLQHDQSIGNGLYAIGVVLYAVSMTWGFVKARSRGESESPTENGSTP
jgi:hypothetical protein